MNRPRKNKRHSQYHWRNRLRRLLSPRTWLQLHASVALDSLGRMLRNRLSSIMTAAVIGIALAMPSGLYLLLDNVDRLSGSWDGQASLSIFLKDSVTPAAASRLVKTVQGWPEIDSVELVTPEQALAEFSQRSGFADVLETLERNPLPTVLIIQPVTEHTRPESAEALRDRFSKLPETELAQLDLEWVQRLSAMLDIARRGVLVIKLIGATNAFVRRPFLYSGLWYGALGAVFAWILVVGGFLLLSAPVARLAGLYQSDFSLQTLPFQLLYLLLGAGMLLGLLGSWLAVGRHLSDIQPR